MIGGRIVLRFAVAAAIAAAVATSVVALGFGVYALLREPLGPAFAAFAVAVLYAAGAWVLALLLNARVQKRSGRDDRDDDGAGFALGAGMGERVGDLIRSRPLLATGAALAAGWIFIRNPALTTLLATALAERSRARAWR